jgi:hypothetical protein
MAKSARDWRQLEAFELEYIERLTAEKKRKDSQFLRVLMDIARGRTEFYSDEVKAQDAETGRLFALRGKILSLREKLEGIIAEPARLMPIESHFTDAPLPATQKKSRIRYLSDPLPEGFIYPVTYEDIRQTLMELPAEHVAPVHEVRLSNQRNTGADGDWLDGEIRLHCAIKLAGEGKSGRRLLGRSEGTSDVIRFGGKTEWGDNNRLYSIWPLEAYRIFVVKRVLVHEVAHGVAELPGSSERVRSAGSIERFCEMYAENFYRPPGPSVKIY